jgi:hypothetical protein
MRTRLLAILLLLNVAFVAQAQDGIGAFRATTRVGATATLIDNLSLITIRDVNLNGPATVDGILNMAPQTSAYSGLLRINGRPGRLVRITYLSSETLIEESGSGAVINAKYLISGFENDNQSASMMLDIGEATVRIGTNGTYYVWLGAILDLTKAAPGSYVSEFLIEMEGN